MFKIKTPKNYIEILKSMSIPGYETEENNYVITIQITIFLIIDLLLYLTITNIYDFSNADFGLKIFIFALLTGFLSMISLSILSLYSLFFEKEFKKKFYKIFKIKKSDKKTIKFIDENIYFIKNLKLSNDKLIYLIQNYKKFEKEIKDIKIQKEKNKKEIDDLQKENLKTRSKKFKNMLKGA